MTASAPRFLMCPPRYFNVEYVINPWMQGHVGGADQALASQQWTRFHSLLSESADVSLMPAINGLPDLVFTANAALVHKETAVLSSFRCPERQPEAQHYADWLAADGFQVKTLPAGILFEGAGDALFDRGNKPLLWLGYGFRSNAAVVPHLQDLIDAQIQPLCLCDPRFYHLDTCFCPLERGLLLYHPAAFDEQANLAIEARVSPECRFAVGEEDAIQFACNAVNIDNRVFLNHASLELEAWLVSHAFNVERAATSEFMKAGGSTKCLSLRLDES